MKDKAALLDIMAELANAPGEIFSISSLVSYFIEICEEQ
jgi:hypothetical protein